MVALPPPCKNLVKNRKNKLSPAGDSRAHFSVANTDFCLHIREALQEANLIKANSKFKKFKFKI